MSKHWSHHFISNSEGLCLVGLLILLCHLTVVKNFYQWCQFHIQSLLARYKSYQWYLLKTLTILKISHDSIHNMYMQCTYLHCWKRNNYQWKDENVLCWVFKSTRLISVDDLLKQAIWMSFIKLMMTMKYDTFFLSHKLSLSLRDKIKTWHLLKCLIIHQWK